MYDGWHHGAALPDRPVVVSFDDGFYSHYAHALPVLRRLGWSGALNLKVKVIGEAGGLSEWQVRALLAVGWELDSHTISHPDLTTLGPEQLRHEVTESRLELRRRFGVPVDFFCYPHGRYNEDVLRAVREAGYLGATTTRFGLATHPSCSPWRASA